MPFAVYRYRFTDAVTAFLIAVFGLLSMVWASSYDLAALEPPDVFTATLDAQHDPLGHAAAARLVIRQRPRPLLLDDRHAQRMASAGLHEAGRG